MDHQLKNPFQISFANYNFEELSNWKINVLQLDATSRLYGQRVDFLHSGAMQILGSVINIEQPVPMLKEKNTVTTAAAIDNSTSCNPILRHLETPEKLNIKIVPFFQGNILLWREILKKRDTLPKLMLNELHLNNELMYTLGGHTENHQVY